MNNPNMNNLFQQFAQFKQNFTGNPQQMIQQMLNNGKITQEQYNQAVQKANELMKIFK